MQTTMPSIRPDAREALDRIPQPVRDLILRNADLPVADYARDAFRSMACPAGGDTADARAFFARELANWLEADGNQVDREGLREEILAGLAIQTGPHAELTLDPATFHTFGLTALGRLANGCRHALVFQGATVTAEQVPKMGPAWLDCGEPFNLFGLAGRRYASISVCAPIGRVSLRALIEAMETMPTGEVARQVASGLVEVSGNSIAECVRRANNTLWREWEGRLGVRVHVIDDFFIADLLVAHIRKWTDVAKALFQPETSATAPGRDEWIRSSLFWAVRDGRIRPLRQEAGRLCQKDGTPWVRYDPSSIKEALERRRILPRLLICFLLMSFIPGLRVLGGGRQLDYFSDLTMAAERLMAAANHEIPASRSMNLLGWGHQIWVRHAMTALDLLAEDSVPDLLRRCTSPTLSEVSNTFELFRRRPVASPRRYPGPAS